MKGSVRTSWPLLAAITGAALTLDASVWPSVVRGSCGDYVTVLSPTETPMPHHDARPSTVPETQQSVPSAPCSRCPFAPNKDPCQGASCSGDQAPLVPPVTTVDRHHESWACWSGMLTPSRSDGVPVRRCSSPLLRIHHIDPIFHPPRAT